MTRPRAMVFVQIPSHFGEMLRVAELLRTSTAFEPVVVFMAPYAGSREHMALCAARGLVTVGPDDFHRYLPAEPRSRSFVTRAWKAAARVVGETLRPVRSGWRALRARVRRARLVLASAKALRSTWRSVRVMGRTTLNRGTRRALVRAIVSVERLARQLRAAATRRPAWPGRIWRRIEATARATAAALGRGARRVLMQRVPTFDEVAARWHAPGSLRTAALVAGGAVSVLTRPAALLLRPAARRVMLWSFGWVYRRLPGWLPPDIQAHRYAFRLAPPLVQALGVRLLVIPEDNFYYFTNVFVRAVHAQGGRAVIVPFTVVNMLEWSEAFYRVPQYDALTVVNRLMSSLFPRWTRAYKGRALIMPPQQILANEYLEIVPPVPWLINSGHADALAVESDFMEQYYLSAGIPRSMLRQTGSLADDVLYEQLRTAASTREQLYVELGLPSNRPMILCALPPNQLAGAGRPECEFDDYRTLIRAFLEPLEGLADEYNVVLSLHPRATAQDAAALEGRRARPSSRTIAELVPLARLFVASCSATIRLAITCGIPVVNYDVFAYDYDDYRDAPGVQTVSSHAAYRAVLNAVASSPEEYGRLQRLQADFARERTRLDGRACERLLALFDHVCREDAAPAPEAIGVDLVASRHPD